MEERTDALARFSIEELKEFWAEIGRSARNVAICISLLEAIVDELATLPTDAKDLPAAEAAAAYAGDALGYALKGQEILTELEDAWK